MKTTFKLSFMMFVEWFIWGAWFVPLWLWLNKSGFSAGEIGWSYACTAIAAILSPILVGSVTDRFFSAQKVLAVLMFAGAVLMYFAAQQTTFAGFFPLLLAYSLTYMPTIALTNSIAFANVPDVERDFPRIRVMGTIGWIASGLACGFLPQMLGYNDISPTNIPLLITAASSALLGVFAFCLPDTPPKSTGKMDIKVMLGLDAIRDGKPIAALENNGVTNGAAMRVSPLGCLLPPTNLTAFIAEVALASSPTHKSDLAVAGAVVVAWAVSRAVNGDTWQSIADSLPAVAHQAQTARITTFSASLSSRLELALNIVRRADGVESASEQLYQIIGAGTSTIESVPCAIAMVELANTDPNRCAVLCANLGGDTDTIGAMATAICGALHGVSAINPQLKQTLDEVNQLDFARYAVALASYRQRREAL